MSENTNTERGKRKQRTGVVTSNKMDKTLVVTVARKARHAKFKKVINISKKYYVHDEQNEGQVGDQHDAPERDHPQAKCNARVDGKSQ